MQRWKIFWNNIQSSALQRCPVFKWFTDQHEIIIVINNVVKIYLQVRNENKTPLIPVFQVIFEDQYLELFHSGCAYQTSVELSY